MHRAKSRGFTLIELMVTLAVVVILAFLAVPSIRDLIDKSRLRGATDDIVNQLNYARASAVKLQQDVNVSADVGTGTWCTGAAESGGPSSPGQPVLPATGCDCTSASSCVVGDQNPVVSSSDYSGATIDVNYANFNHSNGGITFDSKFGALDLAALPTNPLLTVTSPLGKFKTQISISALGQVSVCVPSSSPFVSGYPSC